CLGSGSGTEQPPESPASAGYCAPARAPPTQAATGTRAGSAAGTRGSAAGRSGAGATAQRAGTMSLVLAVAWHRRPLPLIWRRWRADQPGQEWRTAISEVVTAALPRGATWGARGLRTVPPPTGA